MADNRNMELGWDSEIENDSDAFVLLPEGEYPFVVTKFERGRSAGKGKLPPCNMAILTLRINNETTVNEYLVLHTSMEWKLSSFFRAIGQKKHGEKFRMDWTKVLGATGMCKVIVEDYTRDDGTTGQSNKVDKFLDPSETAPVAAAPRAPKAWTAGTF